MATATAAMIVDMPVDVYGLPAIFQHRGESVAISWKLRQSSQPSDVLATVESEYQLQIFASSSNHILSVFWNESGIVQRERTLYLSPLLPIQSALHYSMRLRSSTHTGWTRWSESAQWNVGLGRRLSDWAGAEWICTSAASQDTRSSMLRTEFSLPEGKVITAAVLSIVGLGQFTVRMNGQDVSTDANAPGWTDFRKRILYSTYSVADALIIGSANALAVDLGNGFYNVANPGSRYTKFVGSMGPRMLLARLVVTFQDGSQVVYATTSDGSGGSAWISTDGGPITFTHQYAGEDWNGTLAVPGWDHPGFDPSVANPLVIWGPAGNCTSANPGGALVMSAFEPIRVMEVLSIVNMTGFSTVMIDVGRNHAGYANVTVSNVPAGMVVRVTPSETMHGGFIDQSSGGTPMYWQYITPHSPLSNTTLTVTVMPRFSTYGWRWADVQLFRAEEAHLSPAERIALALSTPSQPNGTLTVLQASYGVNCNQALIGDATAAVASWCDGKIDCPYEVCTCGDNTCGPGSPPCLVDPAQNCAKDFSAVWACSLDPPSFNRSTYLQAEADNNVADVSCNYVPPPPVPIIESGQSNFIRASVATVGTFSCSNQWVNAIHEITLEAIKANMQSVLTDCPHRERLGWLEVSHLMMPSIAYNFDIRALWSKISMDTVDSQQANGMIPDIAPEYTVFSGGFRDSPEWGSAAIMNPAWILSWYGDGSVVNATYATGQGYIDYLLSQRDNATGLLAYGLGDWIPVVPSPNGVTATGILVQDLQAMAAAASHIGRPDDAANYTFLAESTAARFHAAFWNVSAQTYPTQCTAGFALALNITPAALVPAAQSYLLKDVVSRGNVTTSGEIGNRFALVALGEEATGSGVQAVWESLLRNTSPGYGWMLVQGETALAESWTDSPGDSHIHAMYGHIDEFLYSYIAGIQQDRERETGPPTPGWYRVRIAPRMVPGLNWVNATFDSPRGMIRSHWVVKRRTDGGLPVHVSLTVEIPPGVLGHVVLPLTRKRVQIGALGPVTMLDSAE